MTSLNDVNVFSTQDSLFVSTGDDHILKISGDDRRLIEILIDTFTTVNDPEKVFEIVSGKARLGREKFDLLIDYLYSNEILIYETTSKNHKIELHIDLVGSISETEQTKASIKNQLHSKGLNPTFSRFFPSVENYLLQISSNKQPDLILLFSPLFSSVEKIKEFSEKTYSKGVDVLHLGIEGSTILIGPLVSPSCETASISCYFRRKAASIAQVDEVMKIYRYPNLKSIRRVDLSKNRSFGILLELATLEIAKFIENGNTRLLSREIEMDLVKLEMKSTLILKTHFFNHKSIVAPFNG